MRSLSRLVAVGLLTAVAVVCSAAPVLAQSALVGHSLQADHVGGVHVVTVGPDGSLVCEVATERQVDELRLSAPASVTLTELPSLNEPSVSNFRIALRATDQLLERPEALLAFRRAAARWERVIQSDLTVVIDVDFGPERFGTGEYPPGVIASANSATEFASSTAGPSDVIAALQARNTGDAQLQALYSAIPVPTPSTFPTTDGSATQVLGRAIGGLIPLQALGFRPAHIDLDPAVTPFGTAPSIGFSSAFSYDFDPNDGIEATLTDFEAVAAHEIGHALGFTSAVGNYTQPYFTLWDLFRVRPAAVTPGEPLTDGTGWETAVRVITPGPANTEVLVVEDGKIYYEPVQVTFDGIAEYETSTAAGNRGGGDGQQASHWRDDALRPPSLGADRKIGIMDPTIGRGERLAISFADIRLLQLIGYEVSFDPPTGTIALSVGGREIDESLVVSEVSLGDVAIGATVDIPVSVENANPANALDYEAKVEVDAVFPDGVSPTVSVSPESGTVGPSGSAFLVLMVGGVDQPAFVTGRLQVRSNDAARAFIEVPFTFSVGGATEPRLALTTSVPEGGDLGDIGLAETETFPITLQNTGSLPLDFIAYTALATRDFDVSSAVSEAGRRRAAFFSADFENPADLTQFSYDPSGAADRWQVTSGGRATLDGHSTPNAAFFGAVTDGVFKYSNNTFGQLDTPGLDLSGLDPSDLVQVSFRYFLSAEAGYDFASVLVSVDGGDSYNVIATSDGGILKNTVGPNGNDPHWEAVTVEVPGVAGISRPVQLAFRFESDGGVTDEGWYLDDIVVKSIDGASPFYVSTVDGSVAGNETRTLTATVNDSALERGFYRGIVGVETSQRGESPAPVAVTFSVGGAALPTLAPSDPAPSFTVDPDATTPVELSVRNPGDALLAFIRVLEPAASDYEAGSARLNARPATATKHPSDDARLSAELELATSDAGGMAAASLAEVTLPGAALPGDLAQLPDGRILVLDIGTSSVQGSFGQTFLLAPDLSTVTRVPSPEIVTRQASGLAYNERTGTLWMAELSTGLVREFHFDESGAAPALVPTGRSFNAGFAPVGLAYSPELDVLFTTPFQSAELYALDIEGNVPPGYPVLVGGRANVLPGLSFTEGVIEIGGGNLEIFQVGQFGRTFEGAQNLAVASGSVGGAGRINGYLRSRLDPDGVAYAVANPVDGVAKVFSQDPPDLPASVGTPIEAAEPLYSNHSVDPGEAFTLSLIVDGSDISRGTYSEEMAFLTNNPSQPLVRIPIEIQVGAVSAEPDRAGEFVLWGAAPNPVRSSAEVSFRLPEAADATVSVYNALGQRVAVLAASESMQAGVQRLPLDVRGFAAGVYVVRVVAAGHVGTQKLTVAR